MRLPHLSALLEEQLLLSLGSSSLDSAKVRQAIGPQAFQMHNKAILDALGSARTHYLPT